MKRFKFPLKPVAILRAHNERKAREALAVAIGLYVKAEQNLAEIRARTEELEGILFSGRRERFRAMDEAAFLQAYRRECAAEMEGQKLVVTARAEMEAVRAACIVANRELKIIEKLEAHARGKYHVDVLRSEQNDFDEMATQRLLRKAS